MRGFIESGLRGAHPVALVFFSNALEVLDWGSRTWKNIADEDRGAIFKSTFVRGVRSLHISAFMKLRF
jgi:stress-induced-phosphoprotein 1